MFQALELNLNRRIVLRTYLAMQAESIYVVTTWPSAISK